MDKSQYTTVLIKKSLIDRLLRAVNLKRDKYITTIQEATNTAIEEYSQDKLGKPGNEKK